MGVAEQQEAIVPVRGLASAPAETERRRGKALSAIGDGLLIALPGILTLYLAFNAGGHFDGSTALVVGILGLALMIRVAAVARPFAGLGKLLAVVAGALALFAGWVLLSGSWSDAPARAASEFDRVLLYLFALLLFGSALRKPGRLRKSVRVLAASIAVVAFAALATRLFPDEFSTALGLAPDRLSFPLTYWNALGVLMAVGMAFCLHLASDQTEPRAVRALAAGALPAMGTTLLLTFSRGSIAVAAGGLVIYALLARPRGLPAALLAAGPTTAIAMKAAYAADLLASRTESQSAAAAAQGHDVALTVALCCAAAIGLRALLLPLDGALTRLHLPGRGGRAVLAAAATVAALAALAIGAALDVPGEIDRQYDHFFNQGEVSNQDTRTRLRDARLGTRADHWNVAMDAFREDRLRGQGAGTFELLWQRDRPSATEATEAHSLYFETLAELGLVGGVLLAVALATILAGLLVRSRGPNRALCAALASAALIWMVHAGVDWDWEMPAVTLWLFAMAGAALATHRPRGIAGARPGIVPRAVLGVLCLLVVLSAARLVTADRALDEGMTAFLRGDCRTAVAKAHEASTSAGSRPEPYEVRGWCAIDNGRPARAVQAMKAAVERDPHNWRLRYGLGIARASAGVDPRRQLRTAWDLNPLGRVPTAAVGRFRSDDPRVWRRRAREASLPFG
jgi:O-antigen ligase